MSNLFAAGTVTEATRVPVWSKAPESPNARFTAWGRTPVNDEPGFEPVDEADEPALDVEQVRNDAFGQGYAAGIQAGRHEIQPERDALRVLVAGLEQLRPEPTQGLGTMIASTVERLLVEVMGEVEIDRETLLARAQAAAAMIGEETKPSILKLNAADAMRMQDTDLPVALAVDPSLAPGELRLETGSGSIEDGPNVRLARLRAAFERITDAR